MAAKKTFTFQGPLKIVSLYVLIGFLWILFSDQLLAMLVSDRDVFHKIGTYKGWGYVLVTGALLYVLIKRHSDRLTEGENWLRTAYDAANIGTWQYDVPTGIVRFDERARGHYGFDSLEVPYADMMARIHPEDVSRLEQEIARATDSSTKGRYSIEYRVIHVDGSVHWLGAEARIRYVGSRGKRRPILEVGTSRDIAEDKRAELQVRYFSRLYATLSQVNQTIVRSKDRRELFESICKVAVEFGEFRLAWIGLLDHETGVLIPLAEHGFKGNKLPLREINAWEMPYKEGLIGLALRSGRVETSNDIQVEPHMLHWHEAAVRGNYHSAAAIPIRQNGQVTGLLNLYAADIDFFMVKEEQKLLEEMGLDISFALDTMQMEIEHKQAGDALKKSEQKYSVLFDKAAIPAALTKLPEITFADVNEAFEKIFGYSKQEVIGKTSLELGIARPEEHAQTAAGVQQHGSVSGLEKTIFTKSGDARIVLTNTNIVEFGEQQYVITTIQDITERKYAEKELLESEKRYHRVLDTMMEGCQIIDYDWRYVYVNDALAKQGRAKKGDLIGHTMMEVYPGIENTDLFAILRHCMEHRISTRVDNQFTFPDGGTGWFELSIQPVEKGIFILSADITERKRAEARLKESEERFHQLADNIEETFWIFDPIEKKEVYISPAVEKIWMLPVKSFFDNPNQFYETVLPEDRPQVQKTVERQALGEKTELQYRISCPDGSIRWVWDRAFPVFDKKGNLIRVAGIIADISESKKAEMELLELNQNLEMRVKERTAELHAANIALEKASKLKDEFLANMSHELRTPLNAVISLSESLQEGTYGEISPNQGKVLDVIGESGHHLLELINDILDLSKIEAGKMTLQYESLDLQTVCEASLRMVNETAQQNGLRISTSITDEIKTIQADSRRLKQMLVNLLSNAVKFTPRGGNVGLEVQPENEHAIRFTVWDTGIGIFTDQLEKLFTPFVQVDSSLSRKYDGTGLGLALVRQLAEIHNGSIGVESTPGVGSRFYFILPLRAEQIVEENESLEDIVSPSYQPPALQKSAIILLVEDNSTNMMVTNDYLVSNGFKVVTAVNGIQAIEQAETHQPDLILMDIQMPGMSGLEAILRLRSAPEFATVPIIALTALAMPGDRERCLAAGATDYLAKPVSLKKLVEMIARLLK